MARLEPTLDDITFTRELLMGTHLSRLSGTELKALLMLVSLCAAARVWTYSEPDPLGRIAGDDKSLCRYCNLTMQQWRRIKPRVMGYFRVNGDKIMLARDWIAIGVKDKRPNIPAELRSFVMRRDEFTCLYCGTKVGPFDCDHVIPQSQGGATTADNLVCACVPCNRQKRARSPEEWLV